MEPLMYTFRNIYADIERKWWEEFDSDFWQTVLHGPKSEDNIIRSEN